MSASGTGEAAIFAARDTVLICWVIGSSNREQGGNAKEMDATPYVRLRLSAAGYGG